MRRAAAAALVAAVVAGCDCDEGTTKIEPTLGPSETELNFELVAVGDAATRTLRLTAMTNVELTLKARIEDPAGPFKLDTAIPIPEFIPGNAFVDLAVIFTPPLAEVYAGTLVIETNDVDPARGNRRILLSGEGKSPQIEVLPPGLNLSAIACPASARSPRCKDVQTATVSNVGLVPLTLGTLVIKGVGNGSAPAGLAFDKLVSATRLEPQASLPVPISWKPNPSQAPGEAKDYEGVLVVPSNDPAHATIEIPLHAHADPNAAPTACINVLEVTRRKYRLNASGQPEIVTEGVPATEYVDPAAPGEVRVRPGMTVKLTSRQLDPNLELTQPCTTDPEGDALSYAWSITQQPPESRAAMSPAAQAESAVQVDAVGRYSVNLVVKDSLQLQAGKALTLNAIPRDDVVVQLSWQDQDASNADLDLHLVADAGGALTGAGDLFCRQDTFVFNPNPDVFGTSTSVEDDPRFLRDDQGTAGQLESTTLVAAPAGSRFRVAVHYFNREGAIPIPVVPKLTLRLKGTEFGPFQPDTPLQDRNDVWIGAEITFPESGEPTASALQVRRHLDHDFDGIVGVCP